MTCVEEGTKDSYEKPNKQKLWTGGSKWISKYVESNFEINLDQTTSMIRQYTYLPDYQSCLIHHQAGLALSFKDYLLGISPKILQYIHTYQFHW